MLRAQSGSHIKLCYQSLDRQGPVGSSSNLVCANGQVGGRFCQPSDCKSSLPLVICIHGIGSNGNYFDLRTNSFAAAASKRGFPVLLLDRPGYGASVANNAGSAINNGVDAVTSIVQSAIVRHKGLKERPIILVGHSFGGAVALAYAAIGQDIPLAAVCVSGIGDQPDARYLEHLQDLEQKGSLPLFPHWFFGPPSSYTSRAVAALRRATEPPISREVYEISYLWPNRWRKVAASVSCPVHFRLAEYEHIWETTPEAISRISSAFKLSPLIDAAIMPDGGHLYEAHVRGPELVAAQLDFALQAAKMLG
jgi:pimeloyl-ACP methyl ester carboxylesterase